MKRSVFLLTLFASLLAFAGERSAIDAAALAAQFMNQQVNAPARKASVGTSSMKLSHTRLKLNSTEPAFYVFNQTNNEGYVVVSADDRTEDVLMYSDKGTLDVEKVNPNLKFWLNRLQEEISAANDENTYTAAEKKARKATTATAISPLLVNQDGTEITWYQEAPYWNKCPLDGSKNSYTGCVATAAAQIMYKWRYPEKGTGSHSYTTDTKKISVSQNFSQVTFDWANMLPAYDGVSATSDQKDAVAWLMRCCGVACDMDYTNDGSGAWTDQMGQGMVDYFGYTAEKFITMYSKSEYGAAVFSPAEYGVSSSKFETYFNADLEAGRPIIMGGEDSDGGHEFVCDGRNSSGYFHINWGWEGEGNNYCKLSALKPSGSSYNFSSNLDAMIGLQPLKIDTVHVTGVSVSPTTLTLKQKEKKYLTATVSPSDATVKGVTWESSNNAIATVNASGQVTGVAQGSATITAISKEGKKKATCSVTVTNEIIETTDCDNYYYEFTTKCTKGSNTLGDYTWNISLQAGEIQNVDPTKGQQFGSKKTPSKQVSLTSSNPADCLVKTVKVNASIASGGDAELAVYINGTQIGSTQSLTSTNAEYSFSNTSEVQGNMEILLTNSAKAVYLKSIEVNPGGGEDVPVTGVTISASTASIKVGATTTLTATVKPTNATNQNVSWSSNNEEVATVSSAGVVTGESDGTATITVTTDDGHFSASCKVTVTKSQKQDTIYVLPSEAKKIAKALDAGESTKPQVYAVSGYVTYAYGVKSGTQGIWMNDEKGSDKVFQGYNAVLKNTSKLVVGDYVRLFGYIMNYNNKNMEIMDGDVYLVDPQPTNLSELLQESTLTKVLIDGQLFIICNGKVYNTQGQVVK